MSKYSIEQIDASEADIVWQESPQATIFTKPVVIEKLAHEVHWWGVFKGKEIRCVWPVALNDNKQPCIAPFAYWQGPLWTNKGFNQPAHRSLSSSSAIYEKYINLFLNKYGSIVASLHPSLMDVRVFDWWNYHDTEKPKFKIRPRYSAVIDKLQQNKNIQKDYRLVRRQELKKFIKIQDELYFDNKYSNEELINLYCSTVNVEKNSVEEDLKSLSKLVKSGFGYAQTIRKKNNEELCGLILMLNDKEQANLVINLSTDEFKNQGLIAASITKAINTSINKGLNLFDFNGANSPFRGDDKHSYGAKPVLFFEIEYNQAYPN